MDSVLVTSGAGQEETGKDNSLAKSRNNRKVRGKQVHNELKMVLTTVQRKGSGVGKTGKNYELHMVRCQCRDQEPPGDRHSGPGHTPGSASHLRSPPAISASKYLQSQCFSVSTAGHSDLSSDSLCSEASPFPIRSACNSPWSSRNTSHPIHPLLRPLSGIRYPSPLSLSLGNFQPLANVQLPSSLAVPVLGLPVHSASFSSDSLPSDLITSERWGPFCHSVTTTVHSFPAFITNGH